MPRLRGRESAAMLYCRKAICHGSSWGVMTAAWAVIDDSSSRAAGSEFACCVRTSGAIPLLLLLLWDAFLTPPVSAPMSTPTPIQYPGGRTPPTSLGELGGSSAWPAQSRAPAC